MAPSVAVAFVGCKVNQSEVEGWRSELQAAGYTVNDADEQAEALVINTCAVTQRAGRDVRKCINAFRRKAPQAPIIVAGCMAELDPEALRSLPGVVRVIRRHDMTQLAAILSHYLPSPQNLVPQRSNQAAPYWPPPPTGRSARGRALLKVQDGCDAGCSYCVVPMARGRPVSRPLDEVIAAARFLEGEGFREIVLTGIHLGLYGRDLGYSDGLTLLLQELLTRTSEVRLRLSSVEPQELTDELAAELSSSSRLCPHLHVPLQSGSEQVLLAMRRKYSPAEYAERIGRLAKALPGLALGTDIIAGFPGESDVDFAATEALAEKLPFTYLHVFSYSARPATSAAELSDRLSSAERRARTQRLQQLGREKNARYRAQQIGRVLETVIIKDLPDGMMQGLTNNYLRVELPQRQNCRRSLVRVRITHVNEKGLVGEIES